MSGEFDKALSDGELESFEYHGLSSGTATPMMVRDLIVRACREIRSLRSQLSSTREKYEQAVREVEEVRKERSLNSGRLGAFADGIAALQTDYQVERDKNSGLEMEVGRLRRLLRESNEQRDTALRERDELRAENQRLMGVVANDMRDIEALRERLGDK